MQGGGGKRLKQERTLKAGDRNVKKIIKRKKQFQKKKGEKKEGRWPLRQSRKNYKIIVPNVAERGSWEKKRRCGVKRIWGG